MAVIVVLGAGMMGSALCVPLADRGHDLRLVGTPLDAEIIDSLSNNAPHPTLGLALPSAVAAFPVDELATAMHGAEVIVLGVSSAGSTWAADAIVPFARPDVPVLMITKGLVWDGTTLEVLPDVVARVLARSGCQLAPAAIAGPCIAGELARRVPSCVVLAGRDRATLDALSALLETDYYHPRPSTDVIGVEVCAALKNAYAMGVAFAAGIHARSGGEAGSIAMHNLESAVFAQAALEMQTVVGALGGDPRSAVGLAGVGDLDVTNNGGRTGRFGRFLGQGLSRDEAIAAMEGATLECLEILAVMRAATRGLTTSGKLASGALPLLEHLAAVALDGAAIALPLNEFFRSST